MNISDSVETSYTMFRDLNLKKNASTSGTYTELPCLRKLS
jgi:hypothetical protein